VGWWAGVRLCAALFGLAAGSPWLCRQFTCLAALYDVAFSRSLPYPILPCASADWPLPHSTPHWGHAQGGSLYASALSALGLVYGTTERGRDFYSLYLEPAFISNGWYNATLLNLVDDPAAPGAGAHCCAAAASAGSSMLLQGRSPEAGLEVATCIAFSHVRCPLPLLSSAVASETVLTQGLNLAANLNTSLANQLAFK